MDRGLRIGAPDGRHPRPPDPPRPHPRTERRELQATREPKAQSLIPNHAGSHELAFGQCALARVRYLRTTRAKARVKSTLMARYPTGKWPHLGPGFTGSRASRLFERRAH